MERTLELTIRLTKENPCGFVIDTYETQTCMSAGTWGETEEEQKEQLWNEVISWVYLMKEEQEDEDSELEADHFFEMINEQEGE